MSTERISQRWLFVMLTYVQGIVLSSVIVSCIHNFLYEVLIGGTHKCFQSPPSQLLLDILFARSSGSVMIGCASAFVLLFFRVV